MSNEQAEKIKAAFERLEFLAGVGWYPDLTPFVPIVRAALSSPQGASEPAPPANNPIGAAPLFSPELENNPRDAMPHAAGVKTPADAGGEKG